MSRPPGDLPPHLRGEPFAVRDARVAGVTADRLRTGDLARPFHGVRAAAEPVSTRELCAAYAVRMRAGDVFSHTTAASLWSMPLPRWTAGRLLHVTSQPGTRAVRGRGVAGHTHFLGELDVVAVRGLPVASPVATWLQLSTALPWWELVAVADYIVTGLPFQSVLPLADVEELVAAHAGAGSTKGSRARSRALAYLRVGPFSRPETLSRVVFDLAGLPEALINSSVVDARGSFLALPDLQWPEYRLAYEYEGDFHRDVMRYRRDVRRVEQLVDHGWRVVKATADDLFDHPGLLADRVAQRLSAGGWTGRQRHVTEIGPIRR